jgi:tetratricopeptide (TPR) repeat protein
VLTIQIITLNNFKTLGRCLDSIGGIQAKVVVADMGSKDGTLNICIDRGIEIRSIESNGDMSSVRNDIAGPGMNMYLEPWERLIRGSELISSMSGNNAFYVVQGNVLSKQLRFWEHGRFKNPIFETIKSERESTIRSDVVVVSEGQPDSRSRNTLACRNWAESSPASEEPYYYLACSLFAEGKMKEFMSVANTYLSMSKSSDESRLLMEYYMAVAEAAKGDFKSASKRIIYCILARPTFSEFWCMMGDLFRARGAYEKAIEMYKNAIIIGRKRRVDDAMPVELSKYDEYPSRMIEFCKSNSEAKLLLAKNCI